MAKKKISFGLSEAEIDRAIKELNEYRLDIERKAALLRQRIAEEIASTADAGFGSAIVDDLLQGGGRQAAVEVSVNELDNVSVVIAEGADAIWVEFGAGVYHNGSKGSSPHPKGQELGLTIGSYGFGRGSRRVWGYRDKSGQLKLTHGTPAAMPLYGAAQIVCDRVAEIAREVFA